MSIVNPPAAPNVSTASVALSALESLSAFHGVIFNVFSGSFSVPLLEFLVCTVSLPVLMSSTQLPIVVNIFWVFSRI